MKLVLVVVFAVCLLFENAAAQTWVPGTPARRGGRALRTITCDTKNRFQSFCDDDDQCSAKKIFFCNGNGNQLTIDCGSRYCVENRNGAAQCTENRPSTCSDGKTANFECTSEGFFPDPLNCHRFYQCLDDGTGNLLAFDYSCPHPSVFDPSAPNNRFCRVTNGNSAYCSTVNCSDVETFKNILMQFSWFPASSGQYAVTCIKDNSPIVTRCPAGMIADLEVFLPRCEISCTRNSTIADPTDVTRFYECVYNTATRKWNSVLQACYRNWYFDKSLKKCVEAPPCTNGASNPPKCNACFSNKAFVSGSCSDCGTQILDTTSGTCVDCPTGAAYDAAFKGCVCTTVTEAIDTTAKACKTCPSSAEINATTKQCICKNKATDPFSTTPCVTCSDGKTTTATTNCT